MQQKIAFVKTGWSEEYRGKPVVGRHEYIQEAHERFNFRRTPDGRFYGYLPPIGAKYRPPQPEERENWLVIFVAARNGSGPLTVVGWYDDAVFNKEYQIRPEYQLPSGFDKDSAGNEYTYCVHAEKGQLIPENKRSIIVPGDHFKKSPIIYARRGKSSDQEIWRQEFVEVAKQLMARQNAGKKFGKYAHPEVERKFLLTALPPGSVFRADITDHYIIDTTLRLRKMQTEHEVIFKLGQKLRAHPHDTRVILHTNFYISEAEYMFLAATLPSHRLEKRRWRFQGETLPMAIDQFQGSLEGLVMAEVDFGPDGDPSSLAMPSFALAEVTDDERFTGGRLALTDRSQLQTLLAEFNLVL